jgi:hypothetical protein
MGNGGEDEDGDGDGITIDEMGDRISETTSKREEKRKRKVYT